MRIDLESLPLYQSTSVVRAVQIEEVSRDTSSTLLVAIPYDKSIPPISITDNLLVNTNLRRGSYILVDESGIVTVLDELEFRRKYTPLFSAAKTAPV